MSSKSTKSTKNPTSFRLSDKCLQQLRQLAEEENRSMASMIERLIEECIKQRHTDNYAITSVRYCDNCIKTARDINNVIKHWPEKCPVNLSDLEEDLLNRRTNIKRLNYRRLYSNEEDK